jgi:hypothetical protein
MQIRKIDINNRSDTQKFIRVPFVLYKNDPIWVPPLISDMEFALNKVTHPFYHHSNADFYIAESGNTLLGRIALIENQNYKSYTQSKTGFFYFFEVVEDLQVARAILEVAEDWAINRDLDTIFGPKGLIQGDSMGLLVEGFEYRPANGISYNPPYYDPYLVDSGYVKHSDYLSGNLTTDYQLSPRLFDLADQGKKRRGFWVKVFKNKDDMRQWIPQIQKIYNEAFTIVPGFCPITDEEVRVIANRIISIADPRLIKLVLKGDEIAGFLFAYPNISPGLRKARGRMWPFGWFYLLRESQNPDWVDINGIGLLPQYQGIGANAVLYTELEKSIRLYAKEKMSAMLMLFK